MNTSVATNERLRQTTAELSLVIQHVTDTTGYYVRLDHGHNQVVAGTDPAADVTFTCDRATAVAIATGVERAQSAFMAGRLRMGGSVTALLDHQLAIEGLDDATADVRANTDFGHA